MTEGRSAEAIVRCSPLAAGPLSSESAEVIVPVLKALADPPPVARWPTSG